MQPITMRTWGVQINLGAQAKFPDCILNRATKSHHSGQDHLPFFNALKMVSSYILIPYNVQLVITSLRETVAEGESC